MPMLNKPTGWSVGMATEYIALLERYRETVVRLDIAAKRFVPEIRTHMHAEPDGVPSRELLKKVFKVFTNDRKQLSRVNTWQDLSRFFCKKLDTVRCRFEYLNDAADAVLNQLSNAASLDDPASLSAYATSITKLQASVRRVRDAKRRLLTQNHRHQQALVPQLEFNDDACDNTERLHVYSICATTPLPAYLLGSCQPLARRLAEVSDNHAEEPQEEAEETMGSVQGVAPATTFNEIKHVGQREATTRGFAWHEDLKLVNPDEHRHSCTTSITIGISAHDTRSEGNSMPASTLAPRPPPTSDCVCEDKITDKDTGSNTTGTREPPARQPGDPGWIFVVGKRLREDEDRGQALNGLADAAAVALHHNTPGGNWAKLQGHVFAFGLLQHGDEVGVCAFALGERTSDRASYPRVYRRDLFIGPHAACQEVIAAVLDEGFPLLTRTYEHALGWRKHADIKPEALCFIKECSVRVADGHVHSDITLFDGGTTTWRQYSRTAERVWKAWRIVHAPEHQLKVPEGMHGAQRGRSPLGRLRDFSPAREDAARSACSSRTSSPSVRCMRRASVMSTFSCTSTMSTTSNEGAEVSPPPPPPLASSQGCDGDSGRMQRCGSVDIDIHVTEPKATSPLVPRRYRQDSEPIHAGSHSTGAKRSITSANGVDSEDGSGDDGDGDAATAARRIAAEDEETAGEQRDGAAQAEKPGAKGSEGGGDSGEEVEANADADADADAESPSGEKLTEAWTDRSGRFSVAKIVRGGRHVGFATTYLGSATGVSTREQLLDVARQLLRLSLRGLVHGDVRNANIVMAGMRNAYLIDFETVRHEGDPFPSSLDTELAERHPQLVGRRVGYTGMTGTTPVRSLSSTNSTSTTSLTASMKPGPSDANAGCGQTAGRSSLQVYSTAQDWFSLIMAFAIYTGRDFVERFGRGRRVLKDFLDDVIHKHELLVASPHARYTTSDLATIRRIREQISLESWP
ncbi:serine/threonine protein kinase [Salpingoeca rosetta]|uniref:Serine/threonine protein kinase n=1 Tax=Salpingoeca rosetta (strain ATCC 50818 / BSB-021) TaxID=946362 RepID=F2U5V9_SALR5|nr:serine/threonine protein kinase [Salpingoeca rosetta]EGD82900.1 serine/threonine protein kinase [Salpingoeca rosetta]|eukprot:XP_004995264.1 serine/threonine protein kinase [Salpingoeca rosetta]